MQSSEALYLSIKYGAAFQSLHVKLLLKPDVGIYLYYLSHYKFLIGLSVSSAITFRDAMAPLSAFLVIHMKTNHCYGCCKIYKEARLMVNC